MRIATEGKISKQEFSPNNFELVLYLSLEEIHPPSFVSSIPTDFPTYQSRILLNV